MTDASAKLTIVRGLRPSSPTTRRDDQTTSRHALPSATTYIFGNTKDAALERRPDGKSQGFRR